MHCGSVAGASSSSLSGSFDTLRKADKTLADEIERLCHYDIPAAQLKISADAAEAQRAARPGSNVPDACFDAFALIADEQLEQYHRADEVTLASRARYLAVCPDGLKRP